MGKPVSSKRLLMKRILFGGFFLVCLASLILLETSRNEGGIPPAARLAAPDSLFYIEIRDLPESVKRWPETTLSKIFSEPTVERFCSRPLGQIPASWKTAWRALVRLEPVSVYLCCSDWNGKEWVLGAKCQGDLRNWQGEIGDQIHSLSGYRLAAVSADPDRQTSLSPQAEKPIFAVRSGEWLLFSLRQEALRSTLRRVGNEPAGLETSEVFRQCLAHVPSDADFFGFFNGKSPGSDFSLLDWLPSTSAIPAGLIATKLEGANIHDTVFTRASSGQAKLASKGMYLTTPSTLVYASLPLDLLHIRDLARNLARKWGVAQTVKQYLDEVTAAGVDFHKLSEIVQGVEIVINRNPDRDLLNAFFLVEVRDPGRFSEMVRKILEQEFPSRWAEETVGGSKVFRFGAGKSTNLVFGMNGNYFIAAQNEDAYAEAQNRLLDQRIGIHAPSNYKLTDTVQPSAFRFYLDANTLFERGYGSVRPMLVFGAAFVPNLTSFIDPNILPETSEVSKHLTPILMCRRELPDGTLDDSVGPLTAYEASALGVGAAAGLNLIEK
jgi:hypothetical protein